MTTKRIIDVDITARADGKIPGWDTAAGTHLYVAPGSYAEGTSFPGSPASGEKFFHNTYDMLFFFDGTNWLSTNRGQIDFRADAALPFSVTLPERGVYPVWEGSDIYLLSAQAWFLVSGGTALSGSHKWVGTLTKQTAGTLLATFNIDSGASDSRRQTARVDINALVGSSNNSFDITWTKTGTPGGLYVGTTLSFRYVAV